MKKPGHKSQSQTTRGFHIPNGSNIPFSYTYVFAFQHPQPSSRESEVETNFLTSTPVLHLKLVQYVLLQVLGVRVKWPVFKALDFCPELNFDYTDYAEKKNQGTPTLIFEREFILALFMLSALLKLLKIIQLEAIGCQKSIVTLL